MSFAIEECGFHMRMRVIFSNMKYENMKYEKLNTDVQCE